jgi:hypothetical protein
MGLAANPEACHVEIAADEPAPAFVGRAELTQRCAALTGALPDHAYEAGCAPVTGVVAAQRALRALTCGQTHRTVTLLIAAAALGMVDERIATGTSAASAWAERITFEIGWRQLLDGTA